MCENSVEIRYNPDRQVLWTEDGWAIPIETVGVERNNEYEDKRVNE